MNQELMTIGRVSRLIERGTITNTDELLKACSLNNIGYKGFTLLERQLLEKTNNG